MHPIKVVDVELSRPLPNLAGLDGYAAVEALVRLRGRPVASVRVPVEAGACPASALEQAIFAQAARPLLTALVEEEMERGIGHSPTLELQRPRPREPKGEGPPLPLVTVAVCTRDRTDDLADCLAALKRLDHPALDLLVVDNAPTADATERLVRERHPRVRYCREPRPGLDWARNRAIREARGEIVAFTDDDVQVDPGWAGAIAALFAEHPEVEAVTGLVAPVELETEAQVLFESYGGFGRGCQRRWFHAPPAGGGPSINHHGAGRFGTGANMAFRRSLFERIGPFDPALDVGTVTNGGGDLEMFFRVLASGLTLVYEPRALVRHRHRRDYPRLRQQIANNGVGFYSFLVRVALADPRQRIQCLRFGIWWFGWWSLRRLVKSFLDPGGFPRDLILAELWGSLAGLSRYRRARRAAAAIAQDFQDQGQDGEELPPLAAPQPPPLALRPMAVRLVDCDRLTPLADVEGYAAVRVFFTRRGRLRGHVDIAHYGEPIDAARLRDEIAPGVAKALLEEAGERGIPAMTAIFREMAPRPLDPSPLPSPRPEEGERRTGVRGPVSIVVATRNRPEALRECLASLVAQRSLPTARPARPVEIVVVDNDPASGLTPPVAADFPGVVLVSEPRPGLSYARNRGIVASRGEIVVATDDDVVAPPGWLEALLAPFAREDVAAVTGNVLPRELETEAQRLFEAYGGLGRGYRRREYGRPFFDGFRRAVPTWELGATANAAFRASLFADPRIGLLDEALGAGMPTGVGEDTYLFYRILEAGLTLVYEPSAWVWHRHRLEPEAFRRQIFAYSKGHVAYHLTTLLRDGDPRALVRILFELPRAHARRIVRRLLGKSAYPARIVLLEVWGNLIGPWALLRARLRVRRWGRSAGYAATGPDAPPPLEHGAGAETG
jgi:glycosyltransferase involved in cell wall biosynthesis